MGRFPVLAAVLILPIIFRSVAAETQKPTTRTGQPNQQGEKQKQGIPDAEWQEMMRWFYAQMGLKRGLSREASARAFEEDIRRNPNDSFAWWALGNRFQSNRQFEKAIQAHQEAIRLKPDTIDYWWGLAADYREALKPDEETKVINRILELTPKDFKAWDALGKAYASLGKYQQAINAFKESVRLVPGHVDAWLSLGSSYREMKQQQLSIAAYQTAVRYTEQAMRAYPDDFVALEMLGEAYSGLGDRKKVIEVYQELKKRFPELAEAFFQQHVLPQ